MEIVPRIFAYSAAVLSLLSLGVSIYFTLKVRSLLAYLKAHPAQEWLGQRRARHTKKMDAIDRIIRAEEGE